MAEDAVPGEPGGRITTLDAVRGVAVLGILTMNAVSFGLVSSAYFNLDAGGSETPLDWAIGAVGEVFFDQKFMGLFSALFGAGIVLFADRAEAGGRRPVALSLWRNTLLLVIGIVHTMVWEGDILVVYALCAPIVIAVRRLRPRTLFVAGVLVVASSAVLAAFAQIGVDEATGAGVGDGYWTEAGPLADAVGVWLLADFFLRALGLMLIGVALYRTGVITGDRSDADYRRLAWWGLGTGLPIAAAGTAWVASERFSPTVAVVGSVPNTLATIPVVLGYVALIARWNGAGDHGLRPRVRATGRLALTNYLAQTAFGLVVLGGLTDPDEVARTHLAVFVLAVWALQLAWSPAWLRRFRYGPVEWLWRMGTYRRRQPLRLPRPAPG